MILEESNILVVDDDVIDRESIKRILFGSLCIKSIEEATTVEEGIQCIQDRDFDVVLLDYWMPTADGTEFVSLLKQQAKIEKTAIVMMSNSEDDELALKCLHAGAHDFIPKNEITASRLYRAMLHARKRFELESELVESYERVKRLAEHDSLTGLHNRYYFEEALTLALKNRLGPGQKSALLLFDIDKFKFVNDNFGHDVGDGLLVNVVKRIRSCLRGSECFARLGGDEFSIILNTLNSENDATLVARRILRVMAKPFLIKNHEITCSLSIGIAVYPDNADSPESLVQVADIAMYRAKNQGRDQLCFFEEKMQEEFKQRYRLEHEMNSALQNDEFKLHYQPLINNQSQKMVGVEALIRWFKDDTSISPAQFIPVAEESKLIIPIGMWVIESALKQYADWIKVVTKPFVISINISPIQLKERSTSTFIIEKIRELNLSPAQIQLELTETALLDNDVHTLDSIQQLYDYGVKFALDDFGTGFSSISHLLNFPIHAVKIDKSLVPTNKNEHVSFPIFKGLAAMIHSIGLEVIVEGVETSEHLEYCSTCEVEKSQGYYWEKALPAKSIEDDWLKNVEKF